MKQGKVQKAFLGKMIKGAGKSIVRKRLWVEK
jgi:hypothetical protein